MTSARGDRRIEPKENVMPGSKQLDAQQAWWADIEVLLGKLAPDATLEALIPPVDALWDQLKGPSGPAGPRELPAVDEGEVQRRRKVLLGAIARLMDRREPQLLLRLCRVILGGGAAQERAAQLGACKLLFKLSKSESNDRRFRDLGLLALLLSILAPGSAGAGSGTGGASAGLEPAAGSECLLYAAGALKNTSADAANQKALVGLGAVGICATSLRAHTAKLIKQPSGSAVSGEGKAVKPAHVLVQLTATLRNIAVSGSSRKQFVSSGCVEELCALLAAAPAHAELSLNVSRVLAKLSLHEDVRSRLDANPAHLHALLQVLHHHSSERQVLIRLCFILGNLSAAHAPSRDAIAAQTLPLLMTLLEQYTTRSALATLAPPTAARKAPKTVTCGTSTVDDSADPAASAPQSDPSGGCPPHEARGAALGDATSSSSSSGNSSSDGGPGSTGAGAQGGDSSGEPAERVDVLVKLIRLIAHLAISPEIGEQIASAPESLALLRVLEACSMEAQEELQLNAASAVTNLTYYMPEASQLLTSHAQLCQALVPVLVFPNAEGMIEAARALGNLSRRADEHW